MSLHCILYSGRIDTIKLLFGYLLHLFCRVPTGKCAPLRNNPCSHSKRLCPFVWYRRGV